MAHILPPKHLLNNRIPLRASHPSPEPVPQESILKMRNKSRKTVALRQEDDLILLVWFSLAWLDIIYILQQRNKAFALGGPSRLYSTLLDISLRPVVYLSLLP